VYLRFGRPKVENFTHADAPFEIGKAITFYEGSDVSIFATGHLVWKAIEACRMLAEEGIHAELINIHTIKPLDKAAILTSVKKTGCAVSAEEHMINGGLGDSIAQLLSLEYPAPLEMVAINDRFGESGKPEELMKHYGLEKGNIVAAVKKAITRKNS
jgi:transketolase